MHARFHVVLSFSVTDWEMGLIRGGFTVVFYELMVNSALFALVVYFRFGYVIYKLYMLD